MKIGKILPHVRSDIRVLVVLPRVPRLKLAGSSRGPRGAQIGCVRIFPGIIEQDIFSPGSPGKIKM